MRKTFLSIAIAAAAMLPNVAQAQFNTGGGQDAFCGGLSYNTCVGYTYTFNGTNAWTFTFTNLGNNTGALTTASAPWSENIAGTFYSGTIAAIGFSGVTSGSFSGPQANGVNGAMGTVTDLSDGAFAPYYGWEAASPALGANANGVQMQEQVTFSINAGSQFNGQIGIRTQGGPNGCSNKTYMNANGTGTSVIGGSGATQGCSPSTSVPEPASFGLVFAGLAGLFGVTALRRRNQA